MAAVSDMFVATSIFPLKAVPVLTDIGSQTDW